MSGRPPLSFSSTRRPPGRRLLRVAGIVLTLVVVLVVLWMIVLGGLWGYSWWRLGGDDVPALREDAIEALGETRAPEDATTVLVALTDEVDPTVPREPELIAPLALVQAGGPRGEPAVLLLPERVEVDVVDGGARMTLAEVQQEGGADLLVRTLVDFTEVRIDHVASLSVDALPRLVDTVGPLEVCGASGCSEPAGDELRSTLREAEDAERVRTVGDVARALGAELDGPWAVSSPLEVRRVIDIVAQEVTTDASLRGRRLLELTSALGTASSLDVDTLPLVVNRSTDEVIELVEPFKVRFQHLQDGTALAGDAEEAEELEADLLADLEVAVLNGAGVDGLASEVEVVLQTAGFEVIGTGNAPVFDSETTVVNYRDGDDVHELGAFELGEALGGDVSLEPVEERPEFEGEQVDLLVTVGEDRAQ